MITSTTNRPQFYTHGWGPIVFGCVSDQISNYNFKYVFQVYIQQGATAATLIDTIYQEPNPAGTGLLDVQGLVQPFLLVGNSVQFEVNNLQGATFPFMNLSGEYASVYVLVGEQYSAGPTQPLIIYDGISLTQTPGNPSYEIGNRLLDVSTTPVGATIGAIVLPAAADINTAYTHQNQTNTAALASSNQPMGLFTNYTLPGASGGGATVLGQWLTEGPNLGLVTLVDQATLTYLNFNEQWTTSLGATNFVPQAGPVGATYQAYPCILNVNYYNAAGTTIGATSVNNLIGLNGGPWGTTIAFISGAVIRATV